MGFTTAVVAAFRGDDLDLTSGPIAGPLAALALPVVVMNVVQTVYTLVDTFWLGQYSTSALAAITLAFPLAFLLLSISVGLPVAGSIHVAQAIGADEDRRAATAAAQTISYSLAGAAVVGVAGFVLIDDVLLLFDVSESVRRQATTYLRLLSLGLPATVGFVAFIALLRGAGDTLTPLPVMIGSITLNATLDPFLIHGWWLAPELGIRGAAYATLLARGLAALVGLALVVGSWRGFDIDAHQWRPRREWAGRLARTGLPTSVEQVGRGLSLNAVLVVVGTFSTAVVAGYGIGIRLFAMVILGAGGLANAVETATGQNVGAGRLDRAARANYLAAGIAFAVLSLVGIACWLVPRPIVAVFTDDPATIDVATTFLRWVGPSFGFIGVTWTLVGGIRGTGKTVVAMAVVLTTLGIVRLPLAWLGAQRVGPSGIWLAIAISNVVGAALAVGWLRSDRWRATAGVGKQDGDVGTAAAGDD